MSTAWLLSTLFDCSLIASSLWARYSQFGAAKNLGLVFFPGWGNEFDFVSARKSIE